MYVCLCVKDSAAIMLHNMTASEQMKRNEKVQTSEESKREER